MKIGKNAPELNEEAVATQTEANAPKKEKKELHDTFWTISLILAAISFVFVLIAQNAVNNKDVWTVSFFFLKNPLKLKFMNTNLASLIAGGFAVVSLGFGLTRNIMKRQNQLMGYLIGLVAVILSVIAWLSVYTVK